MTELAKTRSVKAAVPQALLDLPRRELQLEVKAVVSNLQASVAMARDHVLSLAREDGHWCGELEGDSILESEYALMLWALGRRGDRRLEGLCRYLRAQQMADGGWAIFPGGDPDINPTVKAYVVLRLCGEDPESDPMKRARATILRCGGVASCNSFTRLLLSLVGLWRWQDAPAVPPELILLPRWFPVNLYEMSSWSRAIVVPLSIIWGLRPHPPAPFDIGEIAPTRRADRLGNTLRERAWYAFFRVVDRLLKVTERIGLFRLTRRRALQRCEEWMIERFGSSAGLGAIFPSIMNSVIALRLRGYAEDHPLVRGQLEELERLEIEIEIEGAPALKLQPCCSPVWDTALCANALLEAGVSPNDESVQKAVSWLLDKEVKQLGDWAIKCPGVEPGGWYFEYANESYPDCDDTAEVLSVLARVRMNDEAEEARRQQVTERALNWMLAMQGSDGGWAAFDKDCNREILTFVPFADHNAMIDPSTVDVTARTVEALVALRGAEFAAVRRGVVFIERNQDADGSWYGRWGANYLYGTWLALCALSAAGAGAGASRRGVEWLLAKQNADGGWGETLRSYVDPRLKGVGASTAAQTSWAMLGLMAAQEYSSPEQAGRLAGALVRAEEFLLTMQKEDGSWEDVSWTGTGFPGVFYLRYAYYDRYFPLQALATYDRWLTMWAGSQGDSAQDGSATDGRGNGRLNGQEFETAAASGG